MFQIGEYVIYGSEGAFFSAWLGGMLFEITGNYTAIWMTDVGLCFFTAPLFF